MPRTFLVKTSKKREGKTVVETEVERCSVLEHSSRYLHKNHEDDFSAAIFRFRGEESSAKLTTEAELNKEKVKRELTKTGIFMPKTVLRFKNDYANGRSLSHSGENDSVIKDPKTAHWSQPVTKTGERKDEGEEWRYDCTSPRFNRKSPNKNCGTPHVFNGEKQRFSPDHVNDLNQRMQHGEKCSYDADEVSDAQRNSIIRRPIALMPEQCHCKQCRVEHSNMAFYGRKENNNNEVWFDSNSVNAKYAGDTRDYPRYVWNSHAKLHGDFSTVSRMLKRKGNNEQNFYYRNEIGHRFKTRNYKEQRADNEIRNEKVIENPELNGSHFKQFSNGSVSSNSPPDVPSWGRGEGGVNEIKVKRELQHGAASDMATNKERKRLIIIDKNDIKYENELRFDSEEDKKQRMNGSKNGFLYHVQVPKADFMMNSVDNVKKEKLIAIKREKEELETKFMKAMDKCQIKRKNSTEKRKGNNAEMIGRKGKSKLRKMKEEEEAMQVDMIEVKIEEVSDEEEWCTAPYTGAPGTKDRKPIFTADDNMDGESNQGGDDNDVGRFKMEKLSRMSPNVLGKQSVNYESYDWESRQDSGRSGSNNDEFTDEMENDSKIKRLHVEFMNQTQDFMSTSRTNRDMREKEKRAIIRRLKEKEAGKKSRAVANWLERKRVAELNEAFELLRKIVPTYGNEDRSLSKIKTLRYASTYINHLAMINEKQCRYGLYDVKKGLVNLLEMDPLFQRCQEHLETRCVI